MKIEHLAIWVDDLEIMKAFYLKYFDITVGDKYTNEKNQYTAYFIYFGEDKTRLELMHKPNIAPTVGQRGFAKGIAHFTISVGGKEKVNELTELLRTDKYVIFSEPRTTGDGYYESVVLDPEGNYLEISDWKFIIEIENIIFDFGGVLVDWNPRYLYKDHFKKDNEMEHFLKNICSDEWNLEQDKGRALSEGTVLLQNKFPEFHSMIQLFYDKWETMLKSDIPERVNLLYKLKTKYKIYGLTNWSAETISIAYNRFPFFKEFDGIVVSGQEKMVKPNKQIYHLLLDRYNLKAANTVFIDDNINNIKVAEEIGLYAIYFESESQLKTRLSSMNVI